MVRLNLEGVWIDIGDFEFEMKWKHPINNSLKGESTTYSTDITAPLTQNNRIAFDYKIFTSSSKTNRYLYGVMYINGSAMNVRCYVKSFSSTSITFYLEQFLSGGVSKMIKDELNLPDIYSGDINAGVMRDVLINIQNGNIYVPNLPENQNKPTTPNIFNAIATPYIDGSGVSATRPSIYADENLLQVIADHYGFTMNNAPENYWVFANQWKIKNSIMIDGSAVFSAVPKFNETVLKYNLYVDAINQLISEAPIIVSLNFSDMHFTFEGISLWLTNSKGVKYLMYENEHTTEIELGHLQINTNISVPAETYLILATKYQQEFTPVLFSGNLKYTVSVNYEAVGLSNIKDAVKFGLAGYYPCWQNLPAVTAKTLIETIALCAGKMVKYENNVVNFINFEDVFGWENAIDVSSKLIDWKQKDFRYLDYNNATVVYKSGKVVASVKINDETLSDKTNAVATIDALRIEDDVLNERNTDSIVLHETTDGHFDVIDKLQMIYSPMVSPKLFQATFIYFDGSQKPLLIRQLGGIFIALESIATTRNTIALKLLKIK